MIRIRLRFVFWLLGLFVLLFLANLKLRRYLHTVILFWLLLPVLSFVITVLFRKRIQLESKLEPTVVSRTFSCKQTLHAKNTGHIPFLLMQNKRQIDLTPSSEKTMTRRVPTGFTGQYALTWENLYLEDLLGFFTFPLQKPKMDRLLVLPLELQTSVPKVSDSLQEGLHTADRKSVTHQTEEVFSVEAYREGESLSRAHWKLSARMQQWMIRHYDDPEERAMHMVVFTANVEEPTKKRNIFLDHCYTIGKHHLDLQEKLYVSIAGDAFHLFEGDRSAQAFAVMLAQIPFKRSEAFSIPVGSREKLWVFVEELTDEILGLVLNMSELGVSIQLFTFPNEEIRKPELSDLTVHLLQMKEQTNG